MSQKQKRKLMILWIPLLLATITYGFGDVLLKQGNMDIGSTLERLLEGAFWLALIMSIPIIASFALAAVSKLLMGYILSKNPLGLTEGVFLALSVIIIFILGVIFFNEIPDLIDIIGATLIVFGILLLSYDKKAEEQVLSEIDDEL